MRKRITCSLAKHEENAYVAIMKHAMRDDVYVLVIGKTIAALRERHGKTQTQLAKDAGLTQSTLSRIESGDTQPDAASLRRLAGSLELTVPELTSKVEQAVEQAERAARKVVAMSSRTPWWVAAVAATGAAGLAALVGFAVAAALGGGAKSGKNR